MQNSRKINPYNNNPQNNNLYLLHENSPLNSFRYTARGSAAVETKIHQDQKLIAQFVEDDIDKELFVSLILIGGYARGEGGFIENHEGISAYNDYDYFIVVNDCGGAQLRMLSTQLSQLASALERQVGVEVDFFPLQKSQLKTLPFTLMYAEMQAGHRIIAGDPNVLASMPTMPISKVPNSEFTRLMLNRGSLLLLNKKARLERTQMSTDQVLKYLNKAVLACGDSELQTHGLYCVSYHEKLARLRTLPHVDKCLVKYYEMAVNHKFEPQSVAFSHAELKALEARIDILWTLQFEKRCGLDTSPKSLLKKLRNIAVNIHHDGWWQTMTGMTGAHIYPREKLYQVLPLLLEERKVKYAKRHIVRLLGVPENADYAHLIKRYFALWYRFS